MQGKCFLYILICLLFFSACRFFQKEDKQQPDVVAKAFDKVLDRSDLSTIVPRGTSYQDSITIIRSYINNWLKQQVVLKKAEDNLNEQQKEVSVKLEEYRNSLITYIYESELILQKLDTSVAEEEINRYYNDHQANFLLKDNIVKATYIKLPARAPKLDKVRMWYQSGSARDSSLLVDYCHQFATDFYFGGDEWLLFDELLKKVPIKTYDKEEYLRNNRFIEVADTSGIYFINIRGFKIKESISPLSFENDNIRALIINKRKLELVDAMEKSAFDDAIRNSDIKIYDVKK
ncbi:MAG: hypothetical protein ABI772_13705 [Bacteroidota bacterium]